MPGQSVAPLPNPPLNDADTFPGALMMKPALLAVTLLLPAALGPDRPSAAAGGEVNESARRIPLAYSVDVVVAGGGTGAVSAAVAAAEAGQDVFLAAPRPYLGDDMTAGLRLWLEKGEKPTDPLAEAASLASPSGVKLPGEPRPNAAASSDGKECLCRRRLSGCG